MSSGVSGNAAGSIDCCIPNGDQIERHHLEELVDHHVNPSVKPKCLCISADPRHGVEMERRCESRVIVFELRLATHHFEKGFQRVGAYHVHERTTAWSRYALELKPIDTSTF